MRYFGKTLLVAVALALTGCNNVTAESSMDILAALPGTWADVDLRNCELGPVNIVVANDKARVDFIHADVGHATLTDARKTFSYRVGEQRGNRLRLDLEGETRKGENGDPVSWDLVMLSRNEFCWNRSDWPSDGCTSSVLRCEG